MWRKLKFLHMWINFKFLHMTDAKKSEISFVVCTIYGILLHFTLFCCKICFFWRFTLFCRKLVFLRFTRYCVEKNLAKNSTRGEKLQISGMSSVLQKHMQMVEVECKLKWKNPKQMLWCWLEMRMGRWSLWREEIWIANAMRLIEDEGVWIERIRMDASASTLWGQMIMSWINQPNRIIIIRTAARP